MTDTVRISAIVLAAGKSSRMQGKHKLLLPVGREPAIRRTVRRVLEAQPREVVVVTGFQAPAVTQALAGLPIAPVFNPDYEEGQVSSMGRGVAALTLATDAIMVCLGDMVLLTGDDYRDLGGVFAQLSGKSILAPHFDGRRGSPVIFSASYLPKIASAPSPIGCRDLIEEFPDEVFVYPSTHDRFVTDIDTPQDYAAVLRRLDLG